VKFPCRQQTGDRHFVVNGSECTHVQSQDSVKEKGSRAESNGIASIDQCLEIQTDQEGCLGKSWGIVAPQKL
jgi:hypothetical protein